jgi:hypothetical protein
MSPGAFVARVIRVKYLYLMQGIVVFHEGDNSSLATPFNEKAVTRTLS